MQSSNRGCVQVKGNERVKWIRKKYFVRKCFYLEQSILSLDELYHSFLIQWYSIQSFSYACCLAWREQPLPLWLQISQEQRVNGGGQE